MNKKEQRFFFKMQNRLVTRYKHLKAKGKHSNKARVAVARELCGFLWEYANIFITNEDDYTEQKAA